MVSLGQDRKGLEGKLGKSEKRQERVMKEPGGTHRGWALFFSGISPHI